MPFSSFTRPAKSVASCEAPIWVLKATHSKQKARRETEERESERKSDWRQNTTKAPRPQRASFVVSCCYERGFLVFRNIIAFSFFMLLCFRSLERAVWFSRFLRKQSSFALGHSSQAHHRTLACGCDTVGRGQRGRRINKCEFGRQGNYYCGRRHRCCCYCCCCL